VPSVLNSIITKRKDAKKCYTKCDSFCGQRKDLKQSAFQEKESLLAACFKQARAECHNYGTLLTERLYTLPQGWALISVHLMTGLVVSSSNTVLCTRLYQESAKCKLLKSAGIQK